MAPVPSSTPTPEGNRGIALDAAGNLYECNYGNFRVNKVTPDGQVSVYSAGTEALPAVYPNYPVFDRAGNLYYTDSGDFDRVNGRLYVVRPDGKTEVLIPGFLHFPNGLAIDPENEWLYVVQSSASNILRMRLRDGGLGDPSSTQPYREPFPTGSPSPRAATSTSPAMP